MPDPRDHSQNDFRNRLAGEIRGVYMKGGPSSRIISIIMTL